MKYSGKVEQPKSARRQLETLEDADAVIAAIKLRLVRDTLPKTHGILTSFLLPLLSSPLPAMRRTLDGLQRERKDGLAQVP